MNRPLPKPTTLEELIWEFCEEFSEIQESNGKDYMNKWVNRNSDRIVAQIKSLFLSVVESNSYSWDALDNLREIKKAIKKL